MSHLENELISSKCIVQFTLPRLHKGKQWYVDFFAYDPARGKMRRKKYMLDHYKNEQDRENIAAILIHNIFEKLKVGWNPFVNARKTRQFTEFSTVLQRYHDYTVVAEQKGILRAKTAVDYRSRLNQMKIYLQEVDTGIKYVYQFDRSFAVDFLDYLILDKDVSPKTRNNYRTWLSTFGTWLKDRLYIDDNPIDEIHMLKEEEKFRDPLTAADLVRLRDYTMKYNPPFYLACMMEYYCFIRPDELRYVRIGDISIKDQTVYVHPEFAKNRKGQVVALNDNLLKIMINQKVFDHPSNEFLFGHKLVPGPEKIYVNHFRIEWAKVRKALGWPKSYQFYSLKDSGIRDLANAEGIVVARDQARHSDVSVTNKYLKNSNVAHEETKHFKGEL
ncbi:MAG: tyrosine-type recombinase/integrase [Prevotella sp.]|nr:tyrosine-type recombinase/integrase [Prevotella sp.]